MESLDYSDAVKADAVLKKYESIKEKVARLYSEWESLQGDN